MGLENFEFKNDKSERKGENDKNSNKDTDDSVKQSSQKEKKNEEEKRRSNAKEKDVLVEINERIPDDFKCTIPGCLGCKALREHPGKYPGMNPQNMSSVPPSGGQEGKNATLQFIQGLFNCLFVSYTLQIGSWALNILDNFLSSDEKQISDITVDSVLYINKKQYSKMRRVELSHPVLYSEGAMYIFRKNFDWVYIVCYKFFSRWSSIIYIWKKFNEAVY